MRLFTFGLALLLALPVLAKKQKTQIDLGGRQAKIARPASRPPKVKTGLLKKPNRKQQKRWEARNKSLEPRPQREGETGAPPQL
jgi:hypothetical protein